MLGVLIGVGSGAKACSSAQQQNSALSVLNVAQSQVTESTSLVEVENGGKLSLSAEIELPYGTLMWASNDEVAALLVPTETGSPLTTVSILRLASGYYFSVLEQAVGAAQGFEIYDVRASEQAVVWTEVNILEGVWRIYGALLSDTALSEPVLLDTNTSDWETPSIALCNTTAFWQLMPNAQGAQKASESFVRCARIGQVTGSASSTGSENGASSEGGMSNAGDSASTAASTSSTAAASSSESASGTANISYETVLTSAGRMSTPLYVCDNLVVATPRAQTSGVYYQLSAINATTHEISDALALPQSMTPLEACYGKTGFMFSFEGIYNYGAGISNLGTYAPKIDARGIDYSSAEWFHFARTPSAPPCWCGDFLMVKSTRSVVGVSLDTDTYFVLDSVSGSDTYGDYLASTGNRSRILIFANINDESQSGGSKYCSARIYSAT